MDWRNRKDRPSSTQNGEGHVGVSISSLLFSSNSFLLKGQHRMVNQCQRVLLPSLLHIIQWLHSNALQLHPMERLLLNFIPRWSEKREIPSFSFNRIISVGCKEDVKVVRRYLKTWNKVWIKDNCGWEMIACFLLWSHFLGTRIHQSKHALSSEWPFQFKVPFVFI